MVGNEFSSNVCEGVEVSIVTSQGYTCFTPNNVTIIQISKSASGNEVVGLSFYVSSEGNSVEYGKAVSFATGGYKVFYLNTSDIENVEKISVTPVVKSSRAEKFCPPVYLESIPLCSSPTVVDYAKITNPGKYTSSDGGSSSGSSSGGGTSDCVVDCSCSETTLIGQTCPGTCNTVCQGKKRDGSVSAPFAIYNWTDLNKVRENLSANYILMKNLSSSDSDYSGIGNTWNPIGYEHYKISFNGSFNGNGKTISDLNASIGYQKGVGLFGYTYDANISNLGVINVNVYGLTHVGALVGKGGGNSIISNCYSNGSVRVNNQKAGGLVGTMADGSTIVNSYSLADVRGPESIGGLVGFVDGLGTVSNSFAIGNVSCIVTDAEDDSLKNAGGLIGEVDIINSANISNSFAIGNVSCDQASAGFIGKVGGSGTRYFSDFFWYNKSQGLNCWDTQNSDCTSIIDITYFYNSSNAPMNSWDTDIWSFTEGQYPKLKWQN